MAGPEDVYRIAISLPGTTCADRHFNVNGRSYAWTWKERVDPKKARVERLDVYAIQVASEEIKQAMIASEPDKYFTEPHYTHYPAVLVRLAAVSEEELEDLLTEGWRLRTQMKKKR